MFEENTDFVAVINRFVGCWTKTYIFYTKKLGESPEEKMFVTEFSLPTKEKTIPVCTVKAYFYARRDKTDDSKFNLFFQFEADELVHSIDSTVRLSWMERWLEKFLKEKLMTRQILFLASEFESTRIDEERLKTLEKKIVPPEKIVVINTIEENMVEFDQVMAGWEDPTSEKENLDLMKTSVFTLFRSFDKEDLGMVSKEEFLDLVRTIGIELTVEDQESIYNHFELNRDGLLDFQKVNPIIVDILLGHVFFHTARMERVLRSKHHYNMALMVLNGGDMFEKVRDLMKECEEKDQENHSTIAWDHFEKMFWGYSKALFSDEERNTVVQLLIDNFKEGTKFRYSKADEHGMPLLIDTLIKFRADIITKGLVENDRNKLESYLLEYLETFDADKTGFLNQAQLLQALRKCPKLKLVELEYLILTQLCPKNAQGDFNYREHSFDIMIYLKMLFEPKNIKRRATYYKSTVMRSDNIQAYTLDTIRESCLKVFHEFQAEALSYEHYYSIFDGLTNIKVTEKEKQEAFYLLDTNQDEFIDEAELTENCQHLHYFLVRNETIENLKNNFIVV